MPPPTDDPNSPNHRSRWSDVPDVVLIAVLQYLRLSDRVNCSYVCRRWSEVFDCPQVWRNIQFQLDTSSDSGQIRAVTKYGCHFRSVTVSLDQFEVCNRLNACRILDELARNSGGLRKLKVKFKGSNPLFYAGSEIINSLSSVLSSPKLRPSGHLTHVDLSGLNVCLNDFLIFDLDQCPNLQCLNVQNQTLICKISPSAVQHVVSHCRKLTDLRLHYCSITDDILDSFCAQDRTPLRFLSMFCTRTEKYHSCLSSQAWRKIVKRYPQLRVCLHFDHTFPVPMIFDILFPEIPMRDLRLETFTDLSDELRYVTTNYSNTLERLSVQSPTSGGVMDEILVNLAQTCRRLEALFVFCVLKKGTIDTVLDSLPKLRETGHYVLNYEKRPAPWIEGWELEEAFSV